MGQSPLPNLNACPGSDAMCRSRLSVAIIRCVTKGLFSWAGAENLRQDINDAFGKVPYYRITHPQPSTAVPGSSRRTASVRYSAPSPRNYNHGDTMSARKSAHGIIETNAPCNSMTAAIAH